MAAATGSIAISSAGGSFDSADYPRFVLGDGTNTLTFVIDNNARGLIDQNGDDARDGDYTTPGLTTPLEDPQKGRLVVPTFDYQSSAKKALLAFEVTDESNHGGWASSISFNDGSGLGAITALPHWVFTDASGNTVKVGVGTATGSNITTDGTWTLVAKYGSSSPRHWLYKKTGAAEYWIRQIDSTNDFRFHVALMQAINHANANSLIDIEAYGATSSGTLQQPSSVANDTYTASEANWVVFMATTAGFAGNACSMEFKDTTGTSPFTSDARKKAMKWGYDEYLASDSNINFFGHHTTSPTNDQFWGNNFDTPIYFRQGTIAGSGSDASLSSANIAEALKEMINASVLGITATRSDSTVSLTNDTDGDVGNVTITTTNEGSLFTVAGMSNTGGGSGSGGSGSMSKRLKISAAQIAISGSGGLSGSADNKSALVLDLGGLSASGSLVSGDVFAIAAGSAGSAPKKITFANLGTAMAGDGLTSSDGVLAVDFNEISEEVIAVADDSFLFVDATDNSTKKERFADYATAIAGDALAASSGVLAVQANSTSFQIASDEVQLASGVAGDGLALSSHVLSVNVDDSGIEINSDALRLKDDGVTGAKLAPAVAGAALAQDGSGNLDVQVDDSSIEVSSDALQVKALGITNAMLAGSIVASKMNNAIFEDLETLGAASADGEFIVATGPGAFAYESGNTARTSLGLGTGDSPQFTNLTLSGDLTVNGSTTTIDTTNLLVEDPLVVLAKNQTSAAALDQGFVFSRSGDNQAMIWDESADEFAFIATDEDGTTEGDVTVSSYAGLHVGAMDIDGAMDVAGASVLNGTLELAGVADASADVSADSFYFLDGDSLVKSESMADYAAAIAGDGLSATAGVLAVDMNELTEGTVAPGSDSFMFIDSDGNVTRKDTIADLATLQAGDGLSASSGSFAVNVDDSGIEINSDSLRLKDLGVTTAKLAADAVTGAKVADDAIDSEHIADGAIDLAHMSANSVDSDQYVDGSIDRAHLAADVIDGTKIEDDAVDSEHIAAGAIDLEHMSANSVDSDQYVDGSIDTAHLGDLQVTTAKLAADAVTGAKVADDAIDSEHIADGAIDLAHMSANSVDSDQYVDGSIDTAHLSADCVTADKLNDDVKGNGIQISAGVLSISHAQEVFASQSEGTTELTLSGTPASDEAVYVFMNGLLLAEGSGRDYTISSGVITLSAANAMQTQDEVVVKFINQ
jgi:hypothetical protein